MYFRISSVYSDRKFQSSKLNNTANDDEFNLIFLNDSNIKDTLEHFRLMFQNRPSTENNLWLFDISNLQASFDSFKDHFESFEIDFDDDILVWDNSNTIWEMYRIAKNYDLMYSYIGSIDKSSTITWSDIPKWKRRKNLQVF